MFRYTIHRRSIDKPYLFILIPVISFVAGWIFATAVPKYFQDTETEAPPVSLDLFWHVWGLLHDDYIEAATIDTRAASYGAIEGMVQSLEDPYTIFLDPDATAAYENSLEGTLEGIGAELSQEDGKLIINGIIKNSPAQESGLQPRDVIYKIDDVFASDISLGDAVMQIRGTQGTQVTLAIIREDVDEPLEIIVTRRAIHIESVEWEDKGEGIFLITINQFAPDTTQEFGRAIGMILEQNPKGLILDVRFNPGGYMDVAGDVVSEFIAEGAVVRVKDKTGEVVHPVDGTARATNVPLVVLVDAGSASAAEIVAGALQDYKRATLVGTQTFGKGTVQELRALPEGASLKLTVARWYTALGRDINKVGLRPDVVVEFSEEDIAARRDVQLEAAIDILSEHEGL